MAEMLGAHHRLLGSPRNVAEMLLVCGYPMEDLGEFGVGGGGRKLLHQLPGGRVILVHGVQPCAEWFHLVSPSWLGLRQGSGGI